MKKLFNKVLKFHKFLVSKRYSTLAGSMSFFLILSFIPSLFLILIIFDRFNLSLEVDFTNSNIPNNIANILNYIFNNTKEITGEYSLLFLLTAVYSASNLFHHIIRSVELIYNKAYYKESKMGRIVPIILLIMFLFLIALLFFLYAFIQLLLVNINVYLRFFINLLLVILTFLTIVLYLHKYLTPIKVKFKDCIQGASFTVFFSIFASLLFFLYINNYANYEKIYGALALIIVILLWIYILMIGFIIGLIINYKYQKKTEYYKKSWR